MLGDRVQRDVEGRGQVGDPGLPLGEAEEDGAPGGVGQGAEGVVEPGGGGSRYSPNRVNISRSQARIVPDIPASVLVFAR